MNFSEKLLLLIKKSSPFLRRAILISLDCVCFITSIILTTWFFSNEYHDFLNTDYFWILSIPLILGSLINFLTGQYNSLTRHIGSKIIYQIALRNFLLIIILFFIGLNLKLPIFTIKQLTLLWILTTGTIGIEKFLIRDFLIYFIRLSDRNNLPSVAIYGAGAAGAQLSKTLKSTKSKKINFFLDDDPSLWYRTINGIPIFPPNYLKKRKEDIDQIFLAIPSISRKRQLEIINKINKENIQVKLIPSLEELISGKAKIDNLRSIELNDLLGRETVSPNKNLLGKSIYKSTVCITGAGGSIGSELARQLIKVNPKKLVLLDHNELALYELSKELKSLNFKNVDIKIILGDATKKEFILDLFKKEKIKIIFHAAAYKHVPLVESNPIVGLFNNIVSTKILAEIAKELSLSHFILISSDKAVRPTNIMGCSKRVSELITQAYSQLNSSTKYSMVRFGNVIGSSGSVVPLFIEQIRKGGPITLTHPNITRYFMSIIEACQLVIQVVELSEGGELFLLDMGKPVKILDLATKIINLSGLKIKNKNNLDGDIEIITTGLRPGEKLYEELLIDAKAQSTIHPLIYKAIEKSIPTETVLNNFEELAFNLKRQNIKLSLQILKKLVPEWHNETNFDIQQ